MHIETCILLKRNSLANLGCTASKLLSQSWAGEWLISTIEAYSLNIRFDFMFYIIVGGYHEQAINVVSDRRECANIVNKRLSQIRDYREVATIANAGLSWMRYCREQTIIVNKQLPWTSDYVKDELLWWKSDYPCWVTIENKRLLRVTRA